MTSFQALRQLLGTVRDDRQRWQAKRGLQPGYAGYDAWIADVERRYRVWGGQWAQIRRLPDAKTLPGYSQLDMLMRHGNPARDPVDFAGIVEKFLSGALQSVGQKAIIRRAKARRLTRIR